MPYRLPLAIVIATALSIRGYKKKSLTKSGAVAAFFVGFLTFAAGIGFGIILIAFYMSSSKLTKLKADAKKKIDEDYDAEKGRSASQVRFV